MGETTYAVYAGYPWGYVIADYTMLPASACGDKLRPKEFDTYVKASTEASRLWRLYRFTRHFSVTPYPRLGVAS